MRFCAAVRRGRRIGPGGKWSLGPSICRNVSFACLGSVEFGQTYAIVKPAKAPPRRTSVIDETASTHTGVFVSWWSGAAKDDTGAAEAVKQRPSTRPRPRTAGRKLASPPVAPLLGIAGLISGWLGSSEECVDRRYRGCEMSGQLSW